MSDPHQTSEPAEWRAIGQHTYRIDRDLVLIKFGEQIAVSDLDQLLDCYYEIHKQYGYALALGFSTAAVTVTPPARKRAAARLREREIPLAIADVGGTAVLRIMSTLVFNAIRMFVKSAPVLGFFANEPEARVWLDAQRDTFQRSVKKDRGGQAEPPGPP